VFFFARRAPGHFAGRQRKCPAHQFAPPAGAFSGSAEPLDLARSQSIWEFSRFSRQHSAKMVKPFDESSRTMDNKEVATH
jgi:hypothetical protein